MNEGRWGHASAEGERNGPAGVEGFVRGKSYLDDGPAIRSGYDIVGMRWDARSASNLVILEKSLSEHG